MRWSVILFSLISIVVVSVHCDGETAHKIDPISKDDLEKYLKDGESHGFQAEVDKMMKLIINSLYKNKEIFLRELISNASDALDKIRLLAVSNPDAISANPDLEIRISTDSDQKQIIITDSGVGMTKKDLLNNLGTIAKSGTSEFLSKFKSAKSEQETSDLIGQFGVGFYSAFLVADKVTVISKHNDDEQFIWESDSSKFTVNKDPRGNTLKRGTQIILHLKDEAQDFLKPSQLKDIAKRYSQFINFPIYLYESETKMVDETPAPETEKSEKEDDSVSVEEDKKTEPKKVEKTFWEWKHMNSQKPLWTRKPDDVSSDEYKQFYKAVFDRPYEAELAHIHFKAEGDINFNSVLFIPDKVLDDMFSNRDDRSKAIIRLYVRRVFITDEMMDLMPRYLAFVRGIVDSEDLPLNVSRETLQQSKLLKLIKKKLVRKVIEMINKMDAETFDKFWEKFGLNIKLGVIEDKTNMIRLSKILRFKTSKSGEKLASLEDYVKRMKPKQEKIFYVSAGDLMEAKQLPFVERAEAIGYEVIYLTEAMDEHLANSLTEFDGKKLQNLAKDGVDLQETDEGKTAFEAMQKEFEPLLTWFKDVGLKDKISKAELSNKLMNSPSAIIASGSAWSGNMERLMTAQAYTNKDDSQLRYQQSLKKGLEVNPRHPLIKELKMLVSQNPSDPAAMDSAALLYDTALLRSGYMLPNSVDFAKRIEAVMRKNLNMNDDIASSDPYLPKFDEESVEKNENIDYNAVKDEL